MSRSYLDRGADRRCPPWHGGSIGLLGSVFGLAASSVSATPMRLRLRQNVVNLACQCGSTRSRTVRRPPAEMMAAARRSQPLRLMIAFARDPGETRHRHHLFPHRRPNSEPVFEHRKDGAALASQWAAIRDTPTSCRISTSDPFSSETLGHRQGRPPPLTPEVGDELGSGPIVSAQHAYNDFLGRRELADLAGDLHPDLAGHGGEPKKIRRSGVSIGDVRVPVEQGCCQIAEACRPAIEPIDSATYESSEVWRTAGETL